MKVWSLVAVMAVALSPFSVSADEPEAAAEREPVDPRFAALTERVPDYVLAAPDSAERFELVAQPVLKWTNPLRETQAGGVFLWTDRGRAAAVMCAFWRNRSEYKHEFQSLSDAAFEMTLDGEPVWEPAAAGVAATADSSDAAVADSRELRLVQMRRIAQEYAAYVAGEEDGTRAELRLLSQPLYRYAEEIDAPGVVDGAVFAWVQATDPEVLMRLEAHGNSDGSAEWRVGFARMSRWRQLVERDGEKVWSCDWTPGGKDEPYVVLSYMGEPR